MKRLLPLVAVVAGVVLAGQPFLPAHARPAQNPHPAPASLPRGTWVVLDDCVYVPSQSNDGDSFHVIAGGRRFLFRLYFVDAPETGSGFVERIEEQAKYFGISPEESILVGKVAKDFTREKLSRPFTVRTCFQDALGRSRMRRFYAIVQTATGDLGEQLVENGLARVHGASTNPVGLPSANVEWQKLERLETGAKTEKVGGWGVNFGRMTVRSEKSKDRAAVDPFETFFHPGRVQEATGFGSEAPAASPSPELEASRASVTVTDSVKLDVNSCTKQQLEDLPGIGRVLAQRIIEARPFKSADELRRVKGIGEGRYDLIRRFFE